MKLFPLLLLMLPWCYVIAAEDPASLVADRAAIERVYHDHRTGTKLPFEQAMPLALLEQLVQADRRKESALRQIYGVEVTPAMVEAEVQRINATTRAPDTLAEIKRALGNDPTRFACSMARPPVVERTLHQRFDNDDALHATQRAAAEKARRHLLAKEAVEGMQESTWLLTPRPAGDVPATPAISEEQRASSSSGSYSNEATVQVAQPLGGGPEQPAERRLYFEDLDPQLQNVLRAQLQEPGSVSAVIETPAALLVFLAKEKSIAFLSASCLTVPKRSYEEWLAQPP